METKEVAAIFKRPEVELYPVGDVDRWLPETDRFEGVRLGGGPAWEDPLVHPLLDSPVVVAKNHIVPQRLPQSLLVIVKLVKRLLDTSVVVD